jgi:hypothetical protein
MKLSSDTAGERQASTRDPDFASLPEPLRSVAIDNYRRLREDGRPHDEALRVAAEQAQEYEAARVPGATPD